MKTRKQIGLNIVALLLMSALMLPMLLQFSHVFEEHEHEVCHEQTTHIHEDVPDCQICHFHLASFDYKIPEYIEFIAPSIPQKVENQFSSSLFHSFKIANTQLRGPPYFLS